MDVLFETRWLILSGVLVTLRVFAFSILLAAAAGLFFGILRQSRSKVVRGAATSLIEFFRGISTVVQMFWLYYALPLLGISLDAETAAVIALGLVHGAYGSEIVRGAMQSISRDQWEAAIALGFSRRATLSNIIFPQALVAMLPPIGNALVVLLKGTSIASIITVPELTFRSDLIAAASLAIIPIFGTVLVIYYVIAIAVARGMRLIEKKLGRWRPQMSESH